MIVWQTNEEMLLIKTFFIYYCEIRKVSWLMAFVKFYLNKLCLGHKIMIYKWGEQYLYNSSQVKVIVKESNVWRQF